MATSINKVAECPICLETMKKRHIVQCQSGHSMCFNCSLSIANCPLCRGPMSNTRNLGLEQLIESLEGICKVKCDYSAKGCNYVVEPLQKAAHEAECKFRKFRCGFSKFSNEAQTFGSQNFFSLPVQNSFNFPFHCPWTGNHDDIENHFKQCHKNKTWMTFRTEASMKVDLSHDFSDLQIINFHEGQHYFWYKHMVDLRRQKVFWTFQMIGTSQKARNFYYEFEIFRGPTRKLKVTEVCENDVVDTNKIFDSERCVVVSFTALKTFLNENNDLNFKFRIMSVKNHGTD